jgi:hypothetical protein
MEVGSIGCTVRKGRETHSRFAYAADVIDEKAKT